MGRNRTPHSKQAWATTVGRGAHPQRGFTLVELLITVTVLAVLLVATSASLGIFAGSSSRAELQNATTELLDEFEFARMRASMTNRAVQVVIETDRDPQLVTLFDHAANNCVATATLLRRVQFSSNGSPTQSGGEALFGSVTITGFEPSTLAGICFRPDGRVTQPNGLVIEPGSGSSNLAAGEAQVSLRMRAEKDRLKAITHHVVVPYNGLAKVRYETP